MSDWFSDPPETIDMEDRITIDINHEGSLPPGWKYKRFTTPSGVQVGAVYCDLPHPDIDFKPGDRVEKAVVDPTSRHQEGDPGTVVGADIIMGHNVVWVYWDDEPELPVATQDINLRKI